MTQSIEGGFQVDVTEQVLEFLGGRYDGEQTVEVPGLQVLVVDGIARATRTYNDSDGCHPYVQTDVAEAQRFSVERLWVGGASWQGTMIETREGTIPSGSDALPNYRFVTTEQPRVQTESERAFHEMLTQTPFLVTRPADQLVGYENNLLVSAADPLAHPVSVPKKTEFGYADALLHTKVHSVSLYTDEAGTKQVVLAVRPPIRSGAQEMPPVPLEHVRFEIEPKADVRLAAFNRALRLNSLGLGSESAEMLQLIETYNTGPIDDLRMSFYRESEYPNRDVHRGMIGRVDEYGQIVSVRPPSTQDLQIHYAASELVLEPQTEQLYLVDIAAGRALSAAHVTLSHRTDQ